MKGDFFKLIYHRFVILRSRSRKAQREYFDTHAGFARADWRRD